MNRILASLGCLPAILPIAVAAGGEASSPRLVVVIVIDQLRGDYLEAFDENFGDGGFHRLEHDGAWFTHAAYRYGALATGPGHASLATGSTPSAHGIVGNDWYALDEGGAGRYCCADASARIVGLPGDDDGGGRGPGWLAVPTFGDQIKAKTNGRGKVWGIALKDRSAILSAGRRANGAIWWDSSSGMFVSSTYYAPALPAWVTSYNESHFVDRFFKQAWDRLLPADAYRAQFVGADADIVRRFHAGEFPKVLGRDLTAPAKAYYDALYASPFGNELVFEAARRAIEAENLGGDADLDLLTIGLSSNDVIGHYFGPDSPEVMDCTLRTDRQLAEFFAWLHGRIGLANCVVALTSDHGVGPLAEYAVAAGIGGGRFKTKKLIRAIEDGIRAHVGDVSTDAAIVRGVIFPWVYLDEAVVRQAGLDLDTVARIAAQVTAQQEGVAAAYAAPDIRAPNFASADDLRQCVANSYFPGRSGHVYLHWKRYWYKGGNQAGHGSAHDYDQHVPVLMMGPGIVPGRYAVPVCPTGMVPTLCKLLDMPAPPGANGTAYAGVIGEVRHAAN